MSEFNLDRKVSMDNRVDATGKKWMIHINRATGLSYARPEPDRSDAVIPKEFSGMWTKPQMLEERIKIYLDKSWDQAELAQQKAERKKNVKRATEE